MFVTMKRTPYPPEKLKETVRVKYEYNRRFGDFCQRCGGKKQVFAWKYCQKCDDNK